MMMECLQLLCLSFSLFPIPLPQATLITEFNSVVQPVQVAFQQQIQNLKTQHEEFVNSLTQQQQQQMQIPPLESEVKSAPTASAPAPAPPSAPPPAAPITQAGMAATGQKICLLGCLVVGGVSAWPLEQGSDKRP